VVKVGGQQVASKTWDGSTDYEWRQDGLTLTRSSLISVELTLDLRYTDSRGQSHVLEDVKITYDNANNLDKFIEAIAICDMVWGLDFRVSVQEIEEEIQYHAVSYEWRVYNTDGTYTTLPAGAPGTPAATSGHELGSQYAYDTEYVAGTSFYDYDNGLLYTFHGWDTYSHSSSYNPHPSTGYHTLDDGDTNASNNQAIEITDDTYIYGYWTVTELTPSSAHIAIEKVFIVDGQEVPMAEAEDLWFRIDTGIDKDGDGETLIDVDYSMIAASSGGEYKIPVYQYEKPFVFTEQGADVPGYTRTTTIAVSGNHIAGSSINGDSVTVTMDPVYQGENVHLGTVTYTNRYTKNVGTPIHVYPTLTLLKSAADTAQAQSGVGFTLYADDTCTDAVATVTTAAGGIGYLDFTGMAPGTYYLKETAPLAGYHADPYVYPITLTASTPVEELQNGAFVQVTHYSISIGVPEGSTAAHESGSNRLHIFDVPVLGTLNLRKTITGLDPADQSKLHAAVIIHGPITRDDAGTITGIGNTWELELNSENNWEATLGELPIGEYLIHESFASVHGYTWTGVTYGNLSTTIYNNITSGIIRVENDTPISLTLTNTYDEWAAADFFIKKVDDAGNALGGAVFTLSTDEAGANVVATKTTGADGYAHFDGFQEAAVYYLRETKAPAGHYLSDQLYKVTISAVSANANTTYEPEIVLVAGRSTGFDINTDLLTVTNFPVLGKLTITKAFANGLIPQGLAGVSIQVGGPNGYSNTVTLNADNNWSTTLENLPLGEYTVTELDANVPGYTWSVAYSSATVTLAEAATPGLTAPGADIAAGVTVTNTYTRNEEFYEVPTSLTVKKVGEDGTTPLAGAVFTLDRMDAAGQRVVSSVSFTTGENGTVVFDLLSGSIDENGNIIDGKYILSETAAPAGYEKISSTWTIMIKEDDGQLRVVLNENKNVFENFWDWIVGNVSSGTWDGDVLTIQNKKKLGKLTITKTVVDPENHYADAQYAFTLDASDDAFDKTFTLKANESLTIENIPWGTTYTLTEDTTGAAFTSAVTDEGNGKIWADATSITVTNTYAYTKHRNPLSLVKVDAADSTKVIPGAGFTLYADKALGTPVGSQVLSDENGRVALPITAPGTYYLAETTAPTGYYPSTKVYTVTAEEVAVVKNAGTADAVTELQLHIRIADLTGTTGNQIDYTYQIANTAIKYVEVSVSKVWAGNEGVIHPESVEVVLYRNGEAFETVTLSVENSWKHTWTGLTDEFTWTVDEPAVPDGYTKTVTSEGTAFTITNTRQFKEIDVSVSKKWVGDNITHPSSVKVTLYRNGAAYDTVTLSEGNGWKHTWRGLTDDYSWSVDESSVPAGYEKSIRRSGTSFTITNSYSSNPKTGDFTSLAGLISVMGLSGSGLGLTLFLRRKKEEDET